MYDVFGEFDSAQEINELAVNLRKEGDGKSIHELAKKSLGYDMTNDVYLRPRDLPRRHREVVEESRGKEEEMREKQAEEKYSGISERFKKLDRYYHYEDDKYSIRPACSATEIIAEGRTLHHCVGSEDQAYLRNHHEGKSTILFLRKKEEADTPYITIEICGTAIRQWYGAYDKKPDESEIKKWLEQYVTRLKTKKQDDRIRVQVAG